MSGVSLDIQNYAYYYVLRSHARRLVAEAINRRPGDHYDKVTLSSINTEALEYARLEWPKHYGPDTHPGLAFSWENLNHKFSHRPSYFDLAIWQTVQGKRVLQGLALGKPSHARTRLALNWVERSFAPTYLRAGILLPVLACAEEYAKLLGSTSVVIKDAVDPAKYARYGYTPRRIKYVGDVLVKEF